MKITNLASTRPLMSLTGLLGGSSGGPSGQVPTANGSNGVAWGSNVAVITSNGSNALLGPFVNFASGSNVIFTLDQGPIGSAFPSNTLRIHATGSNLASLVVKDEGGVVGDLATTLDFVGAGVTASGTGSIKTITISGSGGGGSGYDLDTYSIDGTDGDDFTGSSLSGSWTRRNFTSGDETYQLGKNATYIRLACGSRANGDGYFRTAPSGTAWTIAMAFVPRFWTSQGVSAWGICVVNSVGTGVVAGFYSAPISPILYKVTTYTTFPGGAGSYVEVGDTGDGPNTQTWPQLYWNNERKVWIYLRRSSDDYYMAVSLDGEIWSPENVTALTQSITVDRVGMMLGPLGDPNGAPNIDGGVIDVDWFTKI